MIHIFVDTNIFLHFQNLGDIPSKDICEEPFDLWIPNKVIAELDEKKDGPDHKLKKRALSALQLIEQLDNESLILKNGVKLNWYQIEPVIDWDELGLNKSISDDLIIGSMVAFRRDFPGDSVGILSHDTGIRMKAKRHGIRKIIPNLAYLLSSDPDPREKELQELRKSVLAEKNRKPKLTAVLVDPLSNKPIAPAILEVKYSKVKILPDDRFEEAIETYMGDVEYMPERPLASDSLRFGSTLFGLRVEDILKYNKEVDHYKDNLRAFFREMNAHQQRDALTIPIDLRVNNDGASPACNVDVRFTIPFGDVARKRPKCPIQPTPPQKPKSILDTGIHAGMLPKLNASFPAQFMGPAGTLIRKSKKGAEILENFSEIKHHHGARIERFYLTFPNPAAATSFSINYEITCREVSDKLIGQINVQVIVT